MADPNKRLETLLKMTASASADSFAWYALALEYRKAGRLDESLSTFDRLAERDPNYLPMYLMAGQTAIEASQRDVAKSWLERGITLAEAKGDMKALGELQSELAGL
jgi:predicted Zn-dependent protease